MSKGEYFYIKSHLNGFVVGIAGKRSNIGAGSKVAMLEKKAADQDHQLWFYHRETDTIRSRLNGLALDLKADGHLTVQIHHTDIARWLVSDCRIQYRKDPKKVLDITNSDPNPGAQLRTAVYSGGANQHWTLDYTDPPLFFIRTLMSNRVIDVYKDEKTPGTKVIMFPQKPYTAFNQLWYTDRQGIIRSKLNDYAFDVKDWKVVLNPYDANNKNQQWQFEDDFIINHARDDEVLDIIGAANKDGAELCNFKRHDGTNQRWTRIYV